MIDYFLQNLWQLWALVAILCLVLELTSGDFFIMCFSIGAACSAIASACGLGWQGCLVVFAAVSVLSLFFVRPVALKHLHNNPGKVSNADAIIGRIGRVSETIVDGGFGRVAIDGDDWKAKSIDGQEIPSGAKVEVVSRDSIIITVRNH